MPQIIRICMLNADTPVPAVIAKNNTTPTYGRIFHHLLSTAATNLSKTPDSHHGATTITSIDFNVVKNEYPPSLSAFDAIVISGSANSAYDNIPWIHKLARWLKDVYDKEPRVRIFGSCFGHQIVTLALLGRYGVRVEKDPQGWELGVGEITLQANFLRRFCGGDGDVDDIGRAPSAPPHSHLTRQPSPPTTAADFLIVGLFALRLARRLIESLDYYAERNADVIWVTNFLAPFDQAYALAKISGPRKEDYVATYQNIIKRMKRQSKYPVRFMQMNPDPSMRQGQRSNDAEGVRALNDAERLDIIDFCDAAAEWGSTVPIPAQEAERMIELAERRKIADIDSVQARSGNLQDPRTERHSRNQRSPLQQEMRQHSPQLRHPRAGDMPELQTEGHSRIQRSPLQREMRHLSQQLEDSRIGDSYHRLETRQPWRGDNYEGEDTSPTTERELKGWFAYPIAAEVFAVVAVGAFLPVILEQLARENGVFFSDRSKPCIDHHQAPVGDATAPKKQGEEQCIVRYLGKDMSTSSFAMYTFSTAVLLQALVLICFSSFADHVIVGVSSLGCSFVLLNAFLPLLVAHYPDNSIGKSLSSDSASDFELESLNPANGPSSIIHRSNPEKLARDLERSAQISSKGVGYGYISAVFVQVLSIGIIFLFSKTSFSKTSPSLSIRIILFMVGVWWAVFSIPTLLWLRPRPGPPLPTQSRPGFANNTEASSKLRTFLFYTSFSLRSFYGTLKRAISLRQTLLFLISWFLLSDAVATISGTAVLFARTELHMGTIAIALLSITSIGSGVVGAFAWPKIQRRYGLQPKMILLCCVAGMEVIPLYGLLGYIPLFKSLGFIGLQQAWEIYPIAVVHGIVMGGISSYARSVYAPLIPEGSEAAFFALFAVTDKGSSAFGPALVGWIVDQAGTIRPAFFFLAVLVVLPAPLLWMLNVEKGREDARMMAEGDGRGRGTYERVMVE
ncbi:ATG22 multi-domain protein [Pyrenophora tritici-repentis]|nr:ATG22 multi-domain protein [Pyrenophora tritici-repentis]